MSTSFDRSLLIRQLNSEEELGGSQNYIYVTAITFPDKKPCLKIGRTSRRILTRLTEYWTKEHRDMNPESICLLAVHCFGNGYKKCTSAEKFMKDAVAEYPYEPGQHRNTERYDLIAFWQDEKEELKKALPFTEHFIFFDSGVKFVEKAIRKHKERELAKVIDDDSSDNESISYQTNDMRITAKSNKKINKKS